MAQESKWLPGQLTFGPLFMLMGLLHTRAGPGMGWYDWVNVGLAFAGVLMLTRGLVFLLVTGRATAKEVAALREQLASLGTHSSQS